MNVHEYQAKAVLREFGVPVPKGAVAFSVQEAVDAAEKLAGDLWVVKAQIHAGGRGKGGGVQVVRSVEEVRSAAEKMLGMTLVTHQTGSAGKTVNRLYVEEGASIARELYLACLVDRNTSRIAFVVSTEGGMDIEEVAARTPEKIQTLSIDPACGYQAFHGRRIAYGLGLEGDAVKQCIRLVGSLYEAFLRTDASLIEVNPLIVDGKGSLLCLDAKMSFDHNGLYRHRDLQDLRDLEEEDPAEVEASAYDLSYVRLEGTVGCIVNGAGLAMATMDLIKLYGMEPANFLDVGGSATQEKVTKAFEIVLSDPRVEAILVNIFGGIMRCDIIANGLVAAAKDLKIKVPLVVRLEGTNVEQGKAVLNQLNESGFSIISVSDLGDAAKKLVEVVQGEGK